MSTLRKDLVVGVVGAGAMGAGIAQVAAVAGHRVVLADALPVAISRAREGHARVLAREVEKGRMSAEDAAAAEGRITYVEGVADLTPFAPCGLVIEAIYENLAAKRELFTGLERVVAPEAVLASNTSSLSIAAIGGSCGHPGRVVGLHFFNPAAVMPLVEVIPPLSPAAAGSPASVETLSDLMRTWGKTPVIASDTPGFIVNRVARPFYGEALRLYEEGIADWATIDWAMRTIGGFRMGPFELMDLIGNDVNLAVTSSVFAGMFYDPRYRPSHTQQAMVNAGRLGRKTGRGYYSYADGAEKPAATEDEALGRVIVDRILAMLINEAVDAVAMRVASPDDIELAMTRGVNYPRGLLAWGDTIGPATVLATLDALYDEYREDRYRASPLLRRTARANGRLLP